MYDYYSIAQILPRYFDLTVVLVQTINKYSYYLNFHLRFVLLHSIISRSSILIFVKLVSRLGLLILSRVSIFVSRR
jgi:hypothetical protein